jgi:hypothetical protein
MSRPNVFFIVGLTLYTLSMRLMPYALKHMGVEIEPPGTFYPWNFSPMTAFCLFGAAYYARTRWAFALPLAVWFAGDLGIWALTGNIEWAFHKNMITVYLGILIIISLGTWLRGKQSIAAVWLTGLVGETVYFLLTNAGEWYLSPTYTKDLAGLEQCFLLALPFFRLSLLSTFAFSTLIFSPYILKERKALAVTTESKPAAT